MSNVLAGAAGANITWDGTQFNGSAGGGAGVSITNAPDVLACAATVTVTSANSPFISLDLTTNVVKFTITAAGFPTNLVGAFTLDLNAGAFSFGFDTTLITNSTLLDISTTKTTPLFFRKPYKSTIWRVRQ